ncbi:hypothetical protein HDU96_000002 [Phlyctochytrium bullatum]|nr:hypothetical protein HDU96_000002 [Phlyctochytrium bullatum]
MLQQLRAVLWGMMVACVVGVNAQWLPQKTKVIKIGYLMPFGVPYDPNDDVSTLSSVIQTLNTVSIYNGVMWYLNRTNNNPNILPDTRLELVPFNSRLDRGVTLAGALQLINQERVAAVIGESNSRNTVTMAVATSVSNVIHCANLATTPQLSNKNDYPTTFRTQSSATLQARSILSVIQSFQKTNIGILASSEEFGSGITQLLQSFASSYNISISLVTVYDINKGNLQDELRTFADVAIQTIVIVASQSPIVNIMRAAQQLGMLDGSYLMISTVGWTDAMFASEVNQALLKNITGTWQLQNPLYEDRVLAPDGSNAEAVDMRTWWNSLFNSNEANVNPGVSKTFNPNTFFMPANAQTANMDFRSNCPNDTQLNIANTVPKFMLARVVNGTRVVLYGAGNMCAGENLRYLEGNLYLFADYMHSSVRCAKTLVSMFDHVRPPFSCFALLTVASAKYTKTSQITIEGINNRTLMTLTKGNITQLVNNANIKDQWGNRIVLDAGGDQVMEQDIFVYKSVNVSSKRSIVTGVSVGKWSPTTNAITFNSEPFLFLGGKTAPPETPVVPTLYFNAKKGMRLAFVAITAVCSALTLALLAYMVVYENFIELTYPRIIIGANISYIAIYLFSIYPMTDQSCIVFGWLKYMGFAVVFGALLVKTHRISVIFAGKKNKSIRLSDGVLFGFFCVIIGLWAAILIVWNSIPSQRPFLQTDAVANVARNGTVMHFFQTDYCNFRDYNYICLGAMVVTLAIGVWLTYLVRNTPSAFNESKWIAIAIYNWVVIGIVLNAISNFAVKDPDVIFVMEALVVILTQTTVAVVLFVPKVIEIIAGRGNNNQTFNGGSSAPSDKEKSNPQASTHVGSILASSVNVDESAMLSRKLEEANRAIRERESKVDELQKTLRERDLMLEEVQKGLIERDELIRKLKGE